MTPPCTFGPFELLERLGVGGMAEVFKALAFGASGFEKVIALKLLREELIGESTFERMFFDEAKVQATLQHRCLVQAHDCGVTDGRPWVRLDYVDGVSLAALLDAGPLPEGVAASVVADVLTGLSVVHRATDAQGRSLGLVHRDVTAANVLLSRSGEVKLGDFGVAKRTALKDQTQGGIRKGSYAYMSPEQVAGKPLDGGSDVFSAGVLLVELLTGRRPFDAATPVETMERIREAAAPDLAGVPAPLSSAVGAMLKPLPKDRPQDLSRLAAELRACGLGEEALAQWAAGAIAAARARTAP